MFLVALVILGALVALADGHVENLKSPRGKRKFSTWARNKTSEESNETSEESFRRHVENKK